MKKPIRHSCVKTLLTTGLLLPLISFAGPEEDLQAGIEAYEIGDLIGAMAFYQSAADAGLAEAQIRLAYIQDYSENDEEAVRLYQAAADQGNSDGLYGLGVMYAKGEGVERNYAKAIEALGQSADLDNARAIVLLARSYEHGEFGLERDPQAAGKLLNRGAELGDHSAMRELITAYQEGTYGVKADTDRSQYWQDRLEKESADNDEQ